MMQDTQATYLHKLAISNQFIAATSHTMSFFTAMYISDDSNLTSSTAAPHSSREVAG
jgi:hypothetical protein